MIWNYFTIYAGLTNGPGNQLGILTAKIKNEDLFRHDAAKVRNYKLTTHYSPLTFRGVHCNVFQNPASNALNTLYFSIFVSPKLII